MSTNKSPSTTPQSQQNTSIPPLTQPSDISTSNTNSQIPAFSSPFGFANTQQNAPFAGGFMYANPNAMYPSPFGAPPQSTPQQPSSAAPSGGIPFVGAKISLISKAGIRYEGTLHNINTDNSTVALKDVRMFGSEGRREGDQIPAQDKVYEYIYFKNTDIQDLTVSTPNQFPYGQPYGYPPMQGGFMPPQGYPPMQRGFMPPPQGFMPPQMQGGFMHPQQMMMPQQQQDSTKVGTTTTPQQQQKPATTGTTASATSNDYAASSVKPAQPTATIKPAIATPQDTTTAPQKPSTSNDNLSEKTSDSGSHSNAWKNAPRNDIRAFEEKAKTFSDFNKEFDFAANTQKFEEEKKELLEDLPEAKKVYDKNSFFDNIEPEQKIRYNAREAYKTDLETFGSNAINHHRTQNFGRRGGFRGRGGPRGGGQGRGGSGGYRRGSRGGAYRGGSGGNAPRRGGPRNDM